MADWLAFVIFIIVSFFTGLSICFNLIAKIKSEEYFFQTEKKAIMLYGVGIIGATVFTGFSLFIILKIQLII